MKEHYWVALCASAIICMALGTVAWLNHLANMKQIEEARDHKSYSDACHQLGGEVGFGTCGNICFKRGAELYP